MWTVHLLVASVVLLAVLVGAALLHTIAKLGRRGRAISHWLSRAPALDVVVTYFTVAPMIGGAIAAGWLGIVDAIIGQFIALQIWCRLHELAHRDAVRGPRIVKVLNQSLGRARNHVALWWTLPAVPMFWCVRVTELIVWPGMIALVKMPRYKQGEWVNLSRQKFEGLVGHDLIWCLYCDWMTGIWSLGTEMLRNIESLWCPIRFNSEKKCENCTQDFPDIDGGWTPANGTMADVAATLEAHYPPDSTSNPWFGHPARLTIEGEDAQAK